MAAVAAVANRSASAAVVAGTAANQSHRMVARNLVGVAEAAAPAAVETVPTQGRPKVAANLPEVAVVVPELLPVVHQLWPANPRRG